MRYLNASQAAKRIGVADKTIRRWLAEGEKGKWKLTAIRTSSNQLAIAESDVERIKRALEQERSQFVVSGQSVNDLDMSGHTVEVLHARIEELEQEVTALKERVATLEQERLTVESKSRPISTFTTSDTSPIPQPQKRPTDKNKAVPVGLPPGTLAVTDFADSIGLDFDKTFKNWIKPDRHLGGDRFEVTSIPHPTRKNYSEKYFTPEQQEKALDILRRHGRLPVSNETEE